MTFSVGRVTVDRVVELESWSFPPSGMFPGVTPELFGGDVLDLVIATYVVRSSGVTVLVDAGNGNDKDRPELPAHHRFRTDYRERLAAVVAPEDVDVVVCTHLHPDHCGGLTRLVDGDWRPSFPRARHLVPAAEYAWARELHATDPTDGPPADLARTFADSVLPVADAGLLELVAVPLEIADGVTVRPAAGHTPGHVVVEIDDGGTFAVISGDALHHPLQFRDLGLAQSGDADPVAAASTRRALVDRLVDRDGLLLPAHFAPGRIESTPDGPRYAPSTD